MAVRQMLPLPLVRRLATRSLPRATLPVVLQQPATTTTTTRRGYASDSKPPNATSQFYKTFTRPIAKVLLLAVFTYQVVYWSWVKLEADEVREERDATIAELEAKVGAYDKAKKDATAEGKKSS